MSNTTGHTMHRYQGHKQILAERAAMRYADRAIVEHEMDLLADQADASLAAMWAREDAQAAEDAAIDERYWSDHDRCFRDSYEDDLADDTLIAWFTLRSR